MKKISCIYATARPGDSMIGRKDVDHISLFLDSLEKQTMAPNEFEVMIADCYYGLRSDHIKHGTNTYRGVKYPFTIYHWQVKSPWLKRGLWTGNAPWNGGIMLSDAELICTFGDCCEPIPEYLKRIWDWYKKGYWAMGLVVYKKDNKLLLKEDLSKKTNDPYINDRNEQLQFIKKNWDLNAVVRDSRWVFVEQSENGIYIPRGFHAGQSFHGYASIPLDALLKLNGFDENFDNDKSLGDCDCGVRALNAGYEEKVLLDRNIVIFENSHESIPDSIVPYKGPTPKSNYALMMHNYFIKRFRANSYILTDEEIDWIVQYSVDNESWAKTYDQRENPHFKWWRKHQPIFDLVELRELVQENLRKGIFEIPEYYKGD